MSRKLVHVSLIFMLLLWGCSDSVDSGYDPPSDHDIDKDGILHKSGLNNPDESCAAYHGSDLRGSDEAPSCYACHGEEW